MFFVGSYKRILIIVLLFAVACLCIYVYYNYGIYPPRFYPRCIIHYLTGYDCPMCGNQRAIVEFLHGNLITAFAYNPFLWISIGYGIIVVALIYKGICKYEKCLYLYIVLYILWGVIRNIRIFVSANQIVLYSG